MRWLGIFAVLLAQPAGWKPPAVRIQDEGTTQGYASTMNCVGAGITCSVGASVATVNVAGGGGGATPGGVSGNVQTNNGAGAFGAYTGTTCAYAVKSLDASGSATCTAAPTIPADISGASYWTRVAESGLSSETALGSLASGLVLNTTTTGVPTIYAGTSCTNQFPRSLNASGAATCASVALADFVANLGTTTTVLHGNAAGQPSYAAVSLTADVSGVLPAANGGTGTSQGSGGCVTLGSANGATTTVGPVTWTGTFNNLIIEYEITGYNGGTPVGRILVGGASISTTALTNGTSGYEGVAGTLTSMLSIPGAPLAITLSSIGRSGTMMIRGRSGALKRYEINGQNGNASVSAASTVYRAVGNFSDLGTNLPLQRAQLTVYDTLTATAASAQAFNSGTTITVIGCP